MFANRFTILHPERVKAATIGSPGGRLAEKHGEEGKRVYMRFAFRKASA